MFTIYYQKENDMLKLILPEEKYWNEFQKMLLEFQNNPSPYDPNCIKGAFKYNNFNAYQKNFEIYRNGINLKEGYVPYTCFWVIKDEKVIGACDVRHGIVPALEQSGGHIAYAIAPSARGKGMGAEALKLCCQYASDKLGIQNVLVTCKATNLASYKTMKKVMIAYGGNEADSTIVKGLEVKRIWIRTKPRLIQIRPLAVAIIRKENKILAFKGVDDVKNEVFYRLIGGGIEFGEKGAETIEREFQEEFGFVPEHIRYVTTVENIFTFNGHQGHEIVLVYEATLPESLKNQERFYGIEENFKDKYAEFVAVNEDIKIYPTGIIE